jgi:hypothetical protein
MQDRGAILRAKYDCFLSILRKLPEGTPGTLRWMNQISSISKDPDIDRADQEFRFVAKEALGLISNELFEEYQECLRARGVDAL